MRGHQTDYSLVVRCHKSNQSAAQYHPDPRGCQRPLPMAVEIAEGDQQYSTEDKTKIATQSQPGVVG